MCALFLVKRPAGSTLFESTFISFTLSIMLLTVYSDTRPGKYLLIGSAICWYAFAMYTFPYVGVYNQINTSKTLSSQQWDIFNSIIELANGRIIEIIFPDNNYRHEGPFELLLKGASDFPSWNISSGKHQVLDRYYKNLMFRSNGSLFNGEKADPSLPYERNRVLVWFDLPESVPLTTKYPELQKAISRPGVKIYTPTPYSTSVKIYIADVPK